MCQYFLPAPPPQPLRLFVMLSCQSLQSETDLFRAKHILRQLITQLAANVNEAGCQVFILQYGSRISYVLNVATQYNWTIDGALASVESLTYEDLGGGNTSLALQEAQLALLGNVTVTSPPTSSVRSAMFIFLVSHTTDYIDEMSVLYATVLKYYGATILTMFEESQLNTSFSYNTLMGKIGSEPSSRYSIRVQRTAHIESTSSSIQSEMKKLQGEVTLIPASVQPKCCNF